MKIMYHGTSIGNINSLDINHCSDCSPFGRAIYLTEDPAVADCYVRKSGCLFQVAIDGDWNRVLDFDNTFDQQTTQVQDVLRKLATMRVQGRQANESVRGLVHPHALSREPINDFLRSKGIWLIRGRLSAMEVSGLMDRGIQYAVLCNENVSILRAGCYADFVADMPI